MLEESRAKPGQSVSGTLKAETWNTLVELARRDRLRRLGEQSGPVGSSLVPSLEALVRNDTGSNVSQGYCLRITGALLDPAGAALDFLARPVFSGAVPSATPLPTDAIAILLEPCGPSELAHAVLLGVAQCQLNVSDTTHLFALAKASDATQMVSSGTGPARILWTETGSTGAQAAVVLLEGGQPPAGGWRVSAITADRTITAADDRTFFEVTATTIDIAITLPASPTVSAGFEVAFRRTDNTFVSAASFPGGGPAAPGPRVIFTGGLGVLGGAGVDPYVGAVAGSLNSRHQSVHLIFDGTYWVRKGHGGLQVPAVQYVSSANTLTLSGVSQLTNDSFGTPYCYFSSSTLRSDSVGVNVQEASATQGGVLSAAIQVVPGLKGFNNTIAALTTVFVGTTNVNATANAGYLSYLAPGDLAVAVLGSLPAGGTPPRYPTTIQAVSGHDGVDVVNYVNFQAGGAGYPGIRLTYSNLGGFGGGSVDGATGTGGGGDTFVSGLCTAVGVGGPTLTVGTTTISGGATGAVLIDSGGTIDEIAPGTTGLPLLSGGPGSLPVYGPIDVGALATDSVTTPKIQAGAVTLAKLDGAAKQYLTKKGRYL